MTEIIARIDEEFESTPVDGCIVLSIVDWKIIKSAIEPKTSCPYYTKILYVDVCTCAGQPLRGKP